MPCPDHAHVWPPLPLKTDMLIEICERSCGWCSNTFLTKTHLLRHANTHLDPDSMFRAALSGQPHKGANSGNQTKSNSLGGLNANSLSTEVKSSDIPVNSTTSHAFVGPNEFSFLPAIFVPFDGFSADNPPPKDRDGRLKRILEDLDKHHNAVRQNMFDLVKQQSEKLVSEAREAAKIEKRNRRGTFAAKGRTTEEKQEMENILKRMMTPLRDNAEVEEYNVKNAELMPLKTYESLIRVDAEGDTVMDGMDDDKSQGTPINYRLGRALHDLTIRAAAEMEAYDKHAKATEDYYHRALKRHIARHGSSLDTASLAPVVQSASTNSPILPATTGPTRGILRNKHDEVRVDRDGWAAINQGSLTTSPVQMEGTGGAWGDQRRPPVDASKDSRMGSGDRSQLARKVSFDQSAFTARR